MFIVEVDFGAQFGDQKRFLEIAVRRDSGRDCTDFSGFVLLMPRQAVTATPQAQVALNAVNAETLDGLDSTAFLRGIPVPIILSGNDGSILGGLTASREDGPLGIIGQAFGPYGNTYGVYG